VREYSYWLDTLPNRESGESGESRIPNPKSRATASESRIPNPESRATTGESRIPNPESRWDVAIVGAGYTGLSAARHLARAGATVVVLEREEIGWGASSRNGGQVLTGLRLEPAALVARFGEARARQLFDAALESIARLETLVAEEAIDCEYARTGHIQAAWKPAHLDAFRA